MTQDSFDRLLQGFLNRRPFRPFTVEMASGSRIEVNHPEALTQEGNTFVCSSSRGMKSYFECHGVVRFIDATGVAWRLPPRGYAHYGGTKEQSHDDRRCF